MWRDYDGPDGLAPSSSGIARRQPAIAHAAVRSAAPKGRDDLGVQAHPGRPQEPEGSRAKVLYSSMQHAREWIAGEVNFRLLNWYIDPLEVR